MLVALSVLTYVLGLALIITVVMQRKDPAAALAWVVTIVFLPIIGALLYLWLGYAHVERRLRQKRKSNEAIAEELNHLEQTLIDYKIVQESTFEEPVQSDLVKVTEGIGAFAITRGNALTLIADPHAVFTQLSEAIQSARDSIHMEYYIFRRDGTGKLIRDLLMEAAKRGVEVRLLVDGVGSWTLGDVFVRPLRRAGAKFARYLPVTFLGRPWHWNLRNHRKITVIDGTLGMIGSLNIGDEYRSRRGNTSDFYDYQIACEGPVVRQLQEVFAGDWFFATGENLLETRHFPFPARRGAALAQVVSSGPDESCHTLHEMVCAAMHAAKRSVRIVTPYFIPDQALTIALRTAALRGAEVQIMLPRYMPNLHEWVVFHAGRSYYEDLLSHGIRFYEYLPGFLHTKSIVVDGCWASVGTANMDIRSFRLNFEVNMNFYSRESVAVLEQHFTENLTHCEEIRTEAFGKRPIYQKCFENTVRMLSPIL